MDAGFGALFRQQCLRPVFRDQFDHQRVRVVGIAEVGRAPNTRGGALGQLANLKSMQTKVALACVAFRGLMVLAEPLLAILVARRFHPRGLGSEDHHLGLVGALSNLRNIRLTKVRCARAVRAGGNAVSAADALVVVDCHDAIGPLPCRAHRTDRHARRFFALHTGPWGEAELDIGKDPELLLDDRSVDHTWRQVILRHTCDCARIAPDAFAGVDDHHPSALLDRLLHRLY